jgi:hypothetical protein
MEFETEWSTTAPDGVSVTVELWADRGRRDAEVRILHGISLGTIEDVDVDAATLDPAPVAVERYGSEWIEAQLLYGQGIIASRLSRSRR